LLRIIKLTNEYGKWLLFRRIQPQLIQNGKAMKMAYSHRKESDPVAALGKLRPNKPIPSDDRFKLI